MKDFQIGAQTFNIDEVMNGQTALQYYDALGQIALRPDLREGTILNYWSSGIEGLTAQLQKLVNGDKRTVKTNPYYWTTYNSDTTIATTVKRNNTPGAAGADVTAVVAASSHSQNGGSSIPKGGHRGYIKELNGQGVNIKSVNRSVSGQHSLVLEPINGESIDLSKFDTYTILVDPLVMYKKGTMDPIVTKGFHQQPPLLRKGYLQMFENGYSIHQDELNGYVYDQEFMLFKGIDANGREIMNWGLPELNKRILTDFIDSKNINQLFGRRDEVKGEGFDGLFPTAEGQGMFNHSYDDGDGVSLKAHLFNMIKGMRKVQGSTDYLLAYDFNFRMSWSEAIASLVKNTSAVHTYKLFGEGGEGARNFKHYEFNDFEAFGYNFRGYQVDAFDHRRYGAFCENFAYLLPLAEFKDTKGKSVSPVTHVTYAGAAEGVPEAKMWAYDERIQGKRVLNVYGQDHYGLEIHCADKTGIFRKRAV